MVVIQILSFLYWPELQYQCILYSLYLSFIYHFYDTKKQISINNSDKIKVLKKERKKESTIYRMCFIGEYQTSARAVALQPMSLRAIYNTKFLRSTKLDGVFLAVCEQCEGPLWSVYALRYVL